MAVIRNKILADARANLSPKDMQNLENAQYRWIHQYTAACGASVNGPPVSLPVRQEIIDCYEQAAKGRVAELVRQLREVIPNYQLPMISGAALAPVGGSLVTDKTAFKVVDIPSNDVLNVREKATSQSRIVGMIPPNGTGIVFAGNQTDDGRWFFVRYGNTTGWVASRYLREEQLSTAAPPPPSPPPPSFSSDRAAEEERQQRQKQAEEERQKQAEAERQRQAELEQQQRQKQAEAERQVLQKKAEEEQLIAKLKELGFRLLTPVDLDLDWKTFMSNNTKVAVRGTYIEAHDVEELFTPGNKDQPRIRLYTDDASRTARKVMLECRNSNFALSSCEMVVGATVQRCVRNKGELNEKEIPCLKVQEAYVIP